MAGRLFVRLEEDVVHGPETNAPAGTLYAYPVGARLYPWVSHILRYRETIPPGTALVERVIPDGAVRIVFDLSTARSPGTAAQVIGPSSRPALVRLEGQMDGLSITLQPGASLSVLGVAANELTDSIVPLELLWNRTAAGTAAGRLLDERSEPGRSRVLDELIGEWTASASRSCTMAVSAWRRITASNGHVAIRDLAAEAGVSERRLQQLFAREIGLAPRTWRRLARLHGCIRALRAGPSSWADVALESGFYDQPHLVRDFQDLCGCAPSEFLQQAISGPSKTPARTADTLRQ